MPTFPRYESYKDSGVEWLGEIPSHWSSKKLKFIAQKISEKIEMKEQSGIYLGLENIESWTGRLIDTELTVEGIANQFQVNDILFGKLRPYLAKVHLARQKGFCTTEALVLRFSKAEPRFFFYLLLSQGFIELVNSSVYGSKMPRASWEFIGSQILPLPQIVEQQRIVEFLDRKTAEIDEAIAHKQRLIELLQEQKAILINQAITKGLNPNMPMRDSGFNWIGNIPVNWQLKRVKHIFRLVAEPAPDNNHMELLSVYSDIGVKPRRELEERGNKASTTDGYWLVKKGDVIVNKLLAWMGAIGLSNYDGVTSPAYDVLRPKTPISGAYYNYLFRMPSCTSELKKHSRGIMEMRLRLYFDRFGVIEVLYPPIEDQQVIANFLKEQEKEFERAFAHIRREISLLEEFKAILIAKAVTGKIKV